MEEVDCLYEICEKYQDRQIVLLGDLNIDTSKQLERRARYLVDFCKRFGFKEPFQLTQPTFKQHSGNGSSRIDYIRLNNQLRAQLQRAEYHILEDHYLNTSSHYPVQMSLTVSSSITPKTETAPQKPSSRLRWPECDTLLYAETLEECLDRMPYSADPDAALTYLTESLIISANRAVPRKEVKKKKAPWNPVIAAAKAAVKVTHNQ